MSRDHDPIVIQKLNHEDAGQRQRLLGYLEPHEPHALFFTGNLLDGYPGQHIYVARRDESWLAVGAYYDIPRSVCVWGRYEPALRAVARHVAAAHPDIEYLNGIGYAAWPAYDELQKIGYTPASDPRQVFMERELPEGQVLPHQPHEEFARVIQPQDADATVMVMRSLSGASGRITDEERRRVQRPHRMVLEIDGRIVSTASSNGMGLRGFQILGVATLPEARRRGYARAVCAAQMRRMQTMGAKYCVLFTNETNTIARGCYEGLGFRMTGDFCVGKLSGPVH
ncbi:MAG: GNAT family N-acetyltransferase [Phycisphaeraceae bacterium]|nr:GNAT family N-acetyltransferase [Phycisphaeraceae bacterium]